MKSEMNVEWLVKIGCIPNCHCWSGDQQRHRPAEGRWRSPDRQRVPIEVRQSGMHPKNC